MRALLIGLVVVVVAVSGAALLATVELGTKSPATVAPTGMAAEAQSAGATSSAPVQFPTSGTRRTKTIWQDPLAGVLLVVGVAAGVAIVARGRRRETAQAA